jgi:hypothetical protein
MTKSNSKRKTRSDKLSLTLHPTGQHCKKIKGKLHYFGSDRRKALQRHLEQASDLHAGQSVRQDSADTNISMICPVQFVPGAPGIESASGGSRGGGIGSDWPFDFAQGRADLEFWPGIGFELGLF